jgi:hypothetical protein
VIILVGVERLTGEAAIAAMFAEFEVLIARVGGAGASAIVGGEPAVVGVDTADEAMPPVVFERDNLSDGEMVKRNTPHTVRSNARLEMSYNNLKIRSDKKVSQSRSSVDE